MLVRPLLLISIGFWICPTVPATANESPKSVSAVTGVTTPELAPIDRLMTEFVAQHKIPGAALAISKQGKLVYARGFGYAEVATQTLVEPNSLFRVASISKPITAVAVLQLVEQRKMHLDDHPFEKLWGDPRMAPIGAPDPRIKEITISQLLWHTGGWDRQVSFDPMFRTVTIARDLNKTPPIRPEDVIRYMGDKPLDFKPGERFAYSNFGYCVLGRLIELATGESYEKYVQHQILDPLGMTRMRLGKTLREEQAPGEVCYYESPEEKSEAVRGPELGQLVPLPYGAWDLEVMDSHGGWIGSAIDLVRFASAFDDPEHSPILNSASIAEMFARPPGLAGHDAQGVPTPAYYSLGWNVRPQRQGLNAWHTGSLDGTSAILVHRHDGFNWAILFNTRLGEVEKAPARLIDPLMHLAVNEVRNWPPGELLFEQLPQKQAN